MKDLKIIADLHTHTIASTHAYSTVLENAEYAASIGLSCIAMTDHAPEMTDSPHSWHFHNLRAIPDYLHGVRILKGAEADIMPDMTIDLDESVEKLELVLASIHPPCYGAPKSIEEHTAAYVAMLKNPYIDIIAHSGLAKYPYDYEEVVKTAAKENKLIEINEHTYVSRAPSIKNCVTIAKLCKKYSVRIAVDSDAHFAYEIGKVENAAKMLDELDFPAELVVNAAERQLNEYLTERRKRIGQIN